MPYKNKEKQKEHNKKYYEDHREELGIQRRKNYSDNSEKINKCRRKKYWEDVEKSRKQAREKYWNDIDKSRKQWKEKYHKNKERIKKQRSRPENKKKISNWHKKHYIENSEKILDQNRKYKETHRKENKEYNKKYYQEHKKERNEWHIMKMKTDPNYRFARMIRSRQYQALKGKRKVGSAVRDMGCTVEEGRKFVEMQFYGNLNWNSPDLELHHKKPLHTFNLEDRKQFLEAFHYTNIQPLTKEDHDRIHGKLS